MTQPSPQYVGQAPAPHGVPFTPVAAQFLPRMVYLLPQPAVAMVQQSFRHETARAGRQLPFDPDIAIAQLAQGKFSEQAWATTCMQYGFGQVMVMVPLSDQEIRRRWAVPLPEIKRSSRRQLLWGIPILLFAVLMIAGARAAIDQPEPGEGPLPHRESDGSWHTVSDGTSNLPGKRLTMTYTAQPGDDEFSWNSDIRNDPDHGSFWYLWRQETATVGIRDVELLMPLRSQAERRNFRDQVLQSFHNGKAGAMVKPQKTRLAGHTAYRWEYDADGEHYVTTWIITRKHALAYYCAYPTGNPVGEINCADRAKKVSAHRSVKPVI